MGNISENQNTNQIIHAYWDDSFDGITPICSNCHMTHHLMIRLPKKCPHCGAIMDKKKGGINANKS